MNLKGDSMSDFLLGMVLGIVIGLAIGKKQKPWSELTEEEKKTQKLLLVFLFFTALLGAVAFVLY
jgi:hypothetical protein